MGFFFCKNYQKSEKFFTNFILYSDFISVIVSIVLLKEIYVYMVKGKFISSMSVILSASLLVFNPIIRAEEGSESSQGIQELREEANTNVDATKHYINSNLDDKIAPLKGTLVEENTWKDNPIIAVMLDNHPDALPQAGLSQADIIYEERVEGSYTRLMAVFNSEKPRLIGPIRSARYNFLQRLFEFNGIITRVGGSYEADEYIANNAVKQIDGSTVSSDVMWRYNDTGKVAPHNMYASYDSLSTYAKSVYEQNLQEVPLKFSSQSDYASGASLVAGNVRLNYGGDNYLEYSYDQDKGIYYRANNGNVTNDENTANAVEIQNLIVQFASSEVYDDHGHQRINQVGEGSGYLFTGGKAIEIKWSKDHSYAQTVYKLADSEEELELKPGLTWINVIEQANVSDDFFN